MVLFYNRGTRRTIVTFNKGKRGRQFERSTDAYLTMELIDKLAKAVENAMPLSKAHSLVAVTQPILRRWIANGQRVVTHVEAHLDWPTDATLHDRLCYELVMCLDQAHGKAIAMYAKRIHQEAKRNWKAASWMLTKLTEEYANAKLPAPTASEQEDLDAAGAYPVTIELPDNHRGSPLPPLGTAEHEDRPDPQPDDAEAEIVDPRAE